mmetsp:Transcript_151061/g.266626  ORF Transcript_151061/g.266626 Transcript_151061/m.266626 type:complete len:402 (-) Transcript_151061:64-1269(-)
MARRLLSEMGILGVDNMCVEKLEALNPEQQRYVADKFVEALMNQDIQNPSKWITAKCGTVARRAKNKEGGQNRKDSPTRGRSRSDSPTSILGDIREIPVKLDPRCVEKMQELDDWDRDVLIKLFLRENERLEIGNPSGWLFARARSRICDKFGKGKGKSSKVWGENLDALKSFARHTNYRPATVADQARLELRRVAEDYSMDEGAIQQMQDLTAQEQLALLSAFRQEAQTQNWSAYESIECSRWLCEKANLIIKEGLSVALGRTSARAAGAEKTPRVRNRTRHETLSPPRSPSGHTGTGKGGYVLTTKLPWNVNFDSAALDKLQELDEKEQDELMKEFKAETKLKDIRNPSGWLVDKARDKSEGYGGYGGWVDSGRDRYSPHEMQVTTGRDRYTPYSCFRR